MSGIKTLLIIITTLLVVFLSSSFFSILSDIFPGSYQEPINGIEVHMSKTTDFYDNISYWKQDELINKILAEPERMAQQISSQHPNTNYDETINAIAVTKKAKSKFFIKQLFIYSMYVAITLFIGVLVLKKLWHKRYISICQSCEYWSLTPKSGYCPKCGNKLISKCPNCEKPFKIVLNNCTNCGTQIKNTK